MFPVANHQILVYTTPVDMRRSIDGLSALIDQELQLMRQQHFGRKSEKIEGQQELNFPEVDRAFDETADLKLREEAQPAESAAKESGAKPGRKPLPEQYASLLPWNCKDALKPEAAYG